MATVKMLANRLLPGGKLALADLDREDGSFHGRAAEVHRGFDRVMIRNWMRTEGIRDFHESTPWIMRKNVAGKPREYPVFLIIGRR